jgi:hypothetical protein
MKQLSRTTKTFTTVVAGATVLAVFGTGTAVAGGLITSKKIQNNTIKSIDVKNNNLKGKDIRDETLTGADVKDYSLTNQDVGVLFAQINSNGTVANSSGGVSAFQPFGAGTYQVSFGRDVSNCAATASVGNANPGGASGSVVQVTDRSGSPQSLFVRTSNREGDTDTDKPFHLIVVC